MIVSHIIGGLGNQMFQYAAGRALSLRLNKSAYVDLSGFPSYQLHHGFELSDVFQCNAKAVTEDQIRNVLGWRSSQKIRSLLLNPRLKWLCGCDFVTEPYFHYWSGFNEVKNDCYLSGYWQSEKYFMGYAKEIREDFTFKAALEGRNEDLVAEMIGQVDAISLHIRRGDYVSHSETADLLGCCSLQYYQDAINYIAKQVKKPIFFVFSDDIAWTEDNLEVDYPCQFIGHNQGESSYMDMQLMSLCNHHIIANSSFSWWGAWLNTDDNKIVIAPKRWFKDDGMERQAGDIVPEGWIRL